jgi:hypothetical protein
MPFWTNNPRKAYWQKAELRWNLLPAFFLRHPVLILHKVSWCFPFLHVVMLVCRPILARVARDFPSKLQNKPKFSILKKCFAVRGNTFFTIGILYLEVTTSTLFRLKARTRKNKEVVGSKSCLYIYLCFLHIFTVSITWIAHRECPKWRREQATMLLDN